MDKDWFIVEKNNKVGIVDKNNNEIIGFLYDKLLSPYLTNFLHAKIGNKWGIIDLQGKPLTIKKRGLKKLTDSMTNLEKMKLVFDCQEL